MALPDRSPPLLGVREFRQAFSHLWLSSNPALVCCCSTEPVLMFQGHMATCLDNIALAEGQAAPVRAFWTTSWRERGSADLVLVCESQIVKQQRSAADGSTLREAILCSDQSLFRGRGHHSRHPKYHPQYDKVSRGCLRILESAYQGHLVVNYKIS